MMLLYTEKQLLEAYKKYVKTFKNTPKLTIPTLEEFRPMYEEYWTEQYEQKRTIN